MIPPNRLDPDGPALTTTEVAEVFRCTPRTVLRWIAQGYFTSSIQTPRRRLIPQQSVIERRVVWEHGGE